MRARGLDLICDRPEHVTSRYVRDPTAARGTEHRTDPAEWFVISAEDQAETIVLRTALDGKGTGEFRGRTIAFRQPGDGIRGMWVVDRLQRIQRRDDAPFDQRSPRSEE